MFRGWRRDEGKKRCEKDPGLKNLQGQLLSCRGIHESSLMEHWNRRSGS